MFAVLLCIPPDYDYNYPPLGTPSLCGFLKNKGIDVLQFDLNLKYRDFLIEHIRGNLSYQEKKTILKVLLKKFFSENLKSHYYSKFLPRNSDGVFPYLPYDNNTNSSFYFTERLLSSEYLFRYLEDEKQNTFYQFYIKEKILDFLDKKNIKFLGISVISPSQIIATLTLGRLAKKHFLDIHICIGGQWPTLYRKVLLKKKEFFNCFDSIVIFEGETTLYRLVEAIKAKRNISIPGIIFKDSKEDFNDVYIAEDLNKLTTPDFDGLFLDDYDAKDVGKRAVTYETSRGCYYSKCAYCVDLPLPKPTYRFKNPSLVIEDIKKLKQKYNIDYLLLSDPSLSPRQMLEISKEILKANINIKWWCMARLDEGFSYSIFKTAHNAGLYQINFGFETASDFLCKLLNKGNKQSRSSRIIRDCSNAGIKVDLQTMLGLPKEKPKDAMDTIDFLISHKQFISHVTFNTYYLTPSNFIYQNPAKYGIVYEEDEKLPFRFFIPFKNKNGLDMEEALQFEKIYYLLLNKNNNESKKESVQPTDVNIPIEKVEFHLNQEVCKMYYCYDVKTDKYIFFEDEIAKEKYSLINSNRIEIATILSDIQDYRSS